MSNPVIGGVASRDVDAWTGGTETRRSRLLREVQRGIGLCKRGEWARGVAHLSLIEQVSDELEWLPGVAHSYLGFGLASERGQYEEGLRRCQTAVKREVWEAENYLNLARTYLLRRKKRQAITAIRRGLEVDPEQPELLALHQRLGVRRQPFFPFLPRGHFLNMFFGKLGHQVRVRAASRGPGGGREVA